MENVDKTTAETVEKIIERLKQISEDLRYNPESQYFLEHGTNNLLEAGWTPEEVFKFLKWMTEITIAVNTRIRNE